MTDGERLTDEQLVHVAGLLLRCNFALMWEGISPYLSTDADDDVWDWAVRTAGARFDQHGLWDSGMLTDEEHASQGCPHSWCVLKGTSGDNDA